MAGLLVAPVEDGKIVETNSQSSLANSKKTDKNSAYSKDTFLKLLVAEVQNQDPLEPTSNTEWISQYATFSELEAMQSMSASYDLSRASALVGKTVVLQTTNEDGKSSTIQGKVDFVTYEGGKAYLSVNGSPYSLDDLYNVVDVDYLNAFDKVYDWTVALNKLPNKERLVYGDVKDVENLYKQYEEMSEYEKTFVAKENADKIKEYHERAQELIKIHDAGNEKPDDEGTEKPGTGEPEGTGTGTTEGTEKPGTGESEDTGTGNTEEDEKPETGEPEKKEA